jgi:uroporphyrinogen-III decarboxylase
MSLYSDRMLEQYIARITKEEGRDAAIKMCADWYDLLEEMSSAGVNTVSVWSELTVALIRLNLTQAVEEVRSESAKQTAAANC